MAGEGVCYVCWEPCSTPSLCRCSAYVHHRCLVKTAIACQTDCCTICKGPIPNLGQLLLVRLRHAEVNPQSGELILLCISSLFFSTLSILFFAASTEQLEHYACVYAMCSFASLTLAFTAARAFSHRGQMHQRLLVA